MSSAVSINLELIQSLSVCRSVFSSFTQPHDVNRTCRSVRLSLSYYCTRPGLLPRFIRVAAASKHERLKGQ